MKKNLAKKSKFCGKQCTRKQNSDAKNAFFEGKNDAINYLRYAHLVRYTQAINIDEKVSFYS